MAEIKLDKIKREYQDLAEKLSHAEIFSDKDKLQQLSKRFSFVKEIIDLDSRLKKTEREIKEHEDIINNEQDEELIEMANSEIAMLKKEKKDIAAALISKMEGKTDNCKSPNTAIMEIRQGTGGDEAALFAGDLYRMYARYAQNKGWKTNVLSSHRLTIGGFKEIIFELIGKDAYKILKNESGVHRVQRIPKTEKSGRVHTSTASVAVLPEAKDIDVEIKPEDLKIDTYRASGPGGQHVNVTSSAVRITHIPTGIVVTSQEGRFQQKNKELAMKVLRTRLLKNRQEEEQRKRSNERKSQIGKSERSEKIRTYNFPQNRITDHRLKKNWSNIEKIMGGDLDIIVRAF